MSVRQATINNPDIISALVELQAMIVQGYPSATFETVEGSDPEGVYLWATIDVEDPDEVTDLIINRVLEIQVEDGLPLFVIPIRSPERVLAAQDAAAIRWARPISLIES